MRYVSGLLLLLVYSAPSAQAQHTSSPPVVRVNVPRTPFATTVGYPRSASPAAEVTWTLELPMQAGEAAYVQATANHLAVQGPQGEALGEDMPAEGAFVTASQTGRYRLLVRGRAADSARVYVVNAARAQRHTAALGPPPPAPAAASSVQVWAVGITPGQPYVLRVGAQLHDVVVHTPLETSDAPFAPNLPTARVVSTFDPVCSQFPSAEYAEVDANKDITFFSTRPTDRRFVLVVASERGAPSMELLAYDATLHRLSGDEIPPCLRPFVAAGRF